MTVPISYRTGDQNPSAFTQTGTLYLENGDTPPYPSANTGNLGFITGALPLVDPSVITDQTQSPAAQDIGWVQGDTVTDISFVFNDALWTAIDPAIPPYPLVAVAHAGTSKGVGTIHTATPHGHFPNQPIVLSGLGYPWDGVTAIASVTDATSFTIPTDQTVYAPMETVTAGTVTISIPVWNQRIWAAQLRNPYVMNSMTSDHWVPSYGSQYVWWRAMSIVGNFVPVVETILVPDVPYTRWGTKVTLTLSAKASSLILPGNWYRWDLQSSTVTNPNADPYIPPTVRTHVRGKANILEEWTL